jgi:hypothetical protein
MKTQSRLLKTLVLTAALFLTSCQSNDKPDKIEPSQTISYFKDQRTGICFAAINSYTYGWSYVTSIATVPCDKVQDLLGERK